MTDLALTKLSETSSAITLGWTPPAGQEGYVPLIDGQDKMNDGKRHASTSQTAKQATIGKMPGETTPVSKHTYGIKILGSVAVGSYPPVTPPPVVSGIPNSLGPWGEKAPDWSDSSKWLSDSASKDMVDQLVSIVKSIVGCIDSYGYGIVTAKSTDPMTSYVKGGAQYGPGPLTYQFRAPVAALGAPGSDGHLAVIQPDGSVVEMYNTKRLSNGTYTCTGSGIAKPGQWTYPKSACLGASFTISAGALLPSEVKDLAVPHALAVMLPSACVKPGWVYPSSDGDGQIQSGKIPEGSRLFLPPATQTSGTKLVAASIQALRDYGMIISDKTTGTDMDIRCQSATSFTSVGQPNPWAAIGITGDYQNLNALLTLLPKLRVAKP